MKKLKLLLLFILIACSLQVNGQGNSLNLSVSDFCGVEFGDAVVRQRIVTFFRGTSGTAIIRMNTMGFTNRDGNIRPVIEAWNRQNNGVTRDIVLVRDGQIVSPKLRLEPGFSTHLEVNDIIPPGSTANYQYLAFTYTENAGVITLGSNIGTAGANFNLSANPSVYSWSLETNLTIQLQATDLSSNASSNANIQSVSTSDPNIVTSFEIIEGRVEIQLDCDYLETVPTTRLEDFSIDFVIEDVVTNPTTGLPETVNISGNSSVELTGIASGYELSGNFTGRNYAVALAGNPIAGSTIAGLMGNWNYAFATYDETAAGTRNIGFSSFTSKALEQTSGNYFSSIVGKGYFLGILDPTKSDENPSTEYPKVFHIPGSATQTGNFSYTSLISFTNTAAADTEDGWNLIANPTKKILFADLDDLTKWPTVSNLDKTVYILDPSDNQYKAFNSLTGTNGFTGQILPYQAFWVKATSANPQLITDIDEALIELPTSPKKYEHPKLSLQLLRDANLKDETVIVLHKEALMDKDVYDAFKMVATDLPAPLIYLQRTNKSLSIEALPFYSNEPIFYDLVISDSITANHAIRIASSFNFTNYWNVELIDTFNKEQISIEGDEVIDFIVEPDIRKAKKATVKIAQSLFKMANTSTENRYSLKITPNTTTALDDIIEVPTAFTLSQNYPNPFNPTTVINYSVPTTSNMQLSIYNSLGQLVQLTNLGTKQTGVHSYNINAINWPSGLYLYRLQSDNGFVSTKKMMLLK